eukprot:CAMPEP_0114243080 /NCGR_PEP_ID=MMETSP0058-20121206/10581_1 /TAXON_ID=36894 /ORGANISM="Pyramimonas parkeae, CCMP726" /LENGTH=75 /DNA_ID=CAMNT_0001355861 /DNA_START=346 /DNA_END=573 /DNA_ORIENTATION=+
MDSGRVMPVARLRELATSACENVPCAHSMNFFFFSNVTSRALSLWDWFTHLLGSLAFATVEGALDGNEFSGTARK